MNWKVSGVDVSAFGEAGTSAFYKDVQSSMMDSGKCNLASWTAASLILQDRVIDQRSNNLLQVEEGSLYPALQRLLKGKLVRAEWTVSSTTNRRVRIYQITKAGLRHLEHEISAFDRMLDGIQMVLGPERGIENSLEVHTMSWWDQFARGRHLHNDLSEESHEHIEEKTEQLMRLEHPSRADARKAAHVAFGNPSLRRRPAQALNHDRSGRCRCYDHVADLDEFLAFRTLLLD